MSEEAKDWPFKTIAERARVALAGAAIWQWRPALPSVDSWRHHFNEGLQHVIRHRKFYGLTLLTAIVSGEVLLDARKHIVIIDPITCEVESLAKYGYKTSTMAPLVVNRIISIEKEAREAPRQGDFRSPEPAQAPTFEDPGSALPLQWLLHLAQDLLRIGPAHMGGEIVQEERFITSPSKNPSGFTPTPTAHLTLHRAESGEYVQLPDRHPFLDDPSNVIDDIATAFLSDRDPYLIATYYFHRYGPSWSDNIISLLERCDRDQEEKSRAASLWGRVLAAQQKFDAAMAKFQEAVKLDPNNSDAYFDVGTVAMARQDYATAIVNYREVVRRQPKLLEAQLNLASALAFARQKPDAVYQETLRRFPGNWLVYSSYATYLYSQDRFLEAENLLRQAAGAVPYIIQHDAWLALGNFLGERKKWTEAEQAFRRALDYEFRKEDVYFSLAYLYLHQDRFPEAVKVLADAGYPNVGPDGDANFAYALEEAGQWETALDFLDGAARAHPYNAFDQVTRAKILADQGYGRQALRELAALANRFPRDAGVLTAWAQLLRDARRPALALAKAQAAAALPTVNGPSADAASLVAVLLAEMGRYPESDAAFQRASSLDPNEPDLWKTWADVLDQLGRTADAAAKRQRAGELENLRQKQGRPIYPKRSAVSPEIPPIAA